MQKDTGGYRRIQGDTGGYRGIQEDTRGYRGIQRDTLKFVITIYIVLNHVECSTLVYVVHRR